MLSSVVGGTPLTRRLNTADPVNCFCKHETMDSSRPILMTGLYTPFSSTPAPLFARLKTWLWVLCLFLSFPFSFPNHADISYSPLLAPNHPLNHLPSFLPFFFLYNFCTRTRCSYIGPLWAHLAVSLRLTIRFGFCKCSTRLPSCILK